jgi:hypothetical protein
VLGKIRKWLEGDPTRSLAPRGTLGVLAIMKNETAILDEWVEHYLWQGADKIFLIDNGSTDHPEKLLADHIAAGRVELYSRPAPHRQVPHYREVFRTARIRRKVEWLAVADLDEFWFSPRGDLKKAIASLENETDLVYSNWIMFGSSGRSEQPPSVREGFVHRWPELDIHRHTKWICRTFALRFRHQIGTHKIGGVDSRRVVSDNHTFRLAHYLIQSREFFQRVKMTRGDVATVASNTVRTWEYFETYDRPATLLDETLAAMVREARKPEASRKADQEAIRAGQPSRADR